MNIQKANITSCELLHASYNVVQYAIAVHKHLLSIVLLLFVSYINLVWIKLLKVFSSYSIIYFYHSMMIETYINRSKIVFHGCLFTVERARKCVSFRLLSDTLILLFSNTGV